MGDANEVWGEVRSLLNRRWEGDDVLSELESILERADDDPSSEPGLAGYVRHHLERYIPCRAEPISMVLYEACLRDSLWHVMRLLHEDPTQMDRLRGHDGAANMKDVKRHLSHEDVHWDPVPVGELDVVSLSDVFEWLTTETSMRWFTQRSHGRYWNEGDWRRERDDVLRGEVDPDDGAVELGVGGVRAWSTAPCAFAVWLTVSSGRCDVGVRFVDVQDPDVCAFFELLRRIGLRAPGYGPRFDPDVYGDRVAAAMESLWTRFRLLRGDVL